MPPRKGSEKYKKWKDSKEYTLWIEKLKGAGKEVARRTGGNPEKVRAMNKARRGQAAWNVGLTKETDERVRKKAEARIGGRGWSRGLSVETDERLARLAESNRGKKRSAEVKEKMRLSYVYYPRKDISISVKCANCGEVLSRQPSALKRRKRFFCNIACQAEWQSENWRGKNNVSYIDGRSYEPYSSGFNRSLKSLIRSRDNYICQKCGKLEIDEGQCLAVHHIDYDKKNCQLDNLISLCNKCNTVANSNRDFWIEFFHKRVMVESREMNQRVQLCFHS